MKGFWDRMRVTIRRGIHWGDTHVPRGVRSVLGVLLMCGGVVGFLPILGFWMLPLGMALIALDIAPLRRRVLAWVERDHACMNGRSE